MNYIKLYEDFQNEELRNHFIEKAKDILNNRDQKEINCETFCIYMVGNFKQFNIISEHILAKKYVKLNVESQLKIGDVISFGYDIPKHYALYIGNGEVYESEGWGEMPKISTVKANLDYYEEILKIYRNI